MSRDRPINAELPPVGGEGESAEAPAPPKPAEGGKPAEGEKPRRRRRVRGPRRPRGRRRSVPTALKAIGATVAVAIAFLVAAVIGGGSDDGGSREGAPAPVLAPPREDDSEASETAAELGYPTFATNNTIRVGGSDAASNAAAVALAVYPSTAPPQRPEAVTLVDGEGWQDAVAASVLMSAPIRAPLLVSGTSELPEATEQALAALDPRGSTRTGGAQAFAIGDAAAPEEMRSTLLPSRGPAATAAAVARLRDRLLGEPPAHLLIAPLGRPGFAAPAAAWAARSGDPVLFSAKDELPAPTESVLKRHPKAPVYVLGPEEAISAEVVREIDAAGGAVSRIAGEDPVRNAIAFARYVDGSFGWNINDPGHGLVVARSDSPLEAALSSPLSASGTWGPLLLTDSAGTLPAALRDYLLDIKPGYTTDPTRAFYNHVWVIGDEEAIDVNQQAEIDGLAEVTKTRGEP